MSPNTIVNKVLQEIVNGKVNVDHNTGFISAANKQEIEDKVNAKLHLAKQPYAFRVEDSNILTDYTLKGTLIDL